MCEKTLVRSPFVNVSNRLLTTYLSVLCTQALEYSHVCKYACSEEVPTLQDMGGPVEGAAISSLLCT